MRFLRSKTGLLLAGCYVVYACSSSPRRSIPADSGGPSAGEGGAAGQTAGGSSAVSEAGQPAAGAAGEAGEAGEAGASGMAGSSGDSSSAGASGASSPLVDCSSSAEGTACQASSGPGLCCQNACVAGQCCVTADCASLGVGQVCTANQCSNVAGTLSGLLWQLPCTGTGDAVSCPTKPNVTVTSTLGGSAGTTYDVALRFRGVVEQKTYVGGCRDDVWQGEGAENGDSYNVYRLSISSPAQTFFLNAGASNVTNTFSILFDKTVRMDAGATVTLYADSKDDTEIKNIDGDGSPVFATGTSVAQPYDGQFIQMDVLSVVPDPVSDVTSAGSAGNALSFAGSQVATVLASDLLQTNNITTEAWFNFQGASGSYNSLLGMAYETATADSYTTWFESGALHAGINLVSTTGSASVAFSATNTWHHIVSSYDYRATQEILYLDGIAVSCVQMPALIAYDGHPLELGGDYDNGVLNGFWNGQLDEVRVFSSVRAPDQVWADMHTRKLGAVTDLGAEWTFDEGAGQTSADSSGHGLNAILGTSSAVEASDPSWITSTAPY